MASPIIILAGPTAAGKTALSLALAEKLNAEILSIDSRQIYKELNIGTAKPTTEELSTIPHHFISERSIHDPVSAGQYTTLAEHRIASLMERGVTPMIVGGSTLYIHALQHGLADIPAVAAHFREELVQRLEIEGSNSLYEELLNVDPNAAQTMDPSKSQRIVRALEVFYGTGKPISYYHNNLSPPRFGYNTYVLFREREYLYERINQRVDVMLDMGLVDEVKNLIKDPDVITLPVLRTIGYHEVIQHLQGMYDHDEMVRLIKRNTRRYAKRQLTWFRRFENYTWINLDSDSDTLIDKILADSY